MSTKKKLLISLCSLCLVAAVVVIGVFAFATQTMTLGTKVSFKATNVAATVTISGKKATGESEGLTTYTDIADIDTATDGNQTSKTWTFAGTEVADSQTSYTIPDAEFVQYTSGTTNQALVAGNIVYTIEIHNTSSTTPIKFTATYSTVTESEISRTVAYKTKSGEANAEYAAATYDQSNGISIAASGYLQITITYSKSGVINDASFTDSWALSLDGSGSQS